MLYPATCSFCCVPVESYRMLLAFIMIPLIQKDQAPVVQTMDSAIHRISNSETNCNIQWIVIYPVDSVIHRLNNWGLDVCRESVWNTHRIHAQKDTILPDGIPNLMYSFPEQYGLEECGLYTTPNAIPDLLFFSCFSL